MPVGKTKTVLVLIWIMLDCRVNFPFRSFSVYCNF